MVINIPKRVLDRFAAKLKPFQGIAASHKDRDVSEADTVTLVKDILSDLFGFDKYQELTSEQQIRGTFCDLAVKIDDKIKLLIEVKAAGLALNDSHLRQAVNYAATEGIEWVALTNAVEWRLYKIKFGQPIDFEVVSSFNFLEVSPRSDDDQRKLFLLCREGIAADAMGTYHQQTQLMNRFTVAQVVLSEPVVTIIRRELRRLFPELKTDLGEISEILSGEVLKRDVIEGEKVKEAQHRLKIAANRVAREAAKKEASDSPVLLAEEPSPTQS
jgi:hypothetical protein